MPRYFFNIYDGVGTPDPNGCSLANIREAQLEAIRLAGRIIADDAVHISEGEDWRMEVTNHEGLMLFRFDFISGISAAARLAPA